MLRGAAACKGAWGQALLRGVQPDQGTMFEVDGRHHTCSTACGAAHGAPTSQRAAHSARSQRCMGLELGKHVFLVEELPHNLILPRYGLKSGGRLCDRPRPSVLSMGVQTCLVLLGETKECRAACKHTGQAPANMASCFKC